MPPERFANNGLSNPTDIIHHAMTKKRPQRRWVRRVKTDSTHPPPRTFAGSASQIARTMARQDVSPKGLGSAIRMIQYSSTAAAGVCPRAAGASSNARSVFCSGDGSRRDERATSGRRYKGASAMTNHVLFVQGGGEGAHDKWDSKIVESLERELGPDYAVRYPRMPHEADPHYADWKAALTREFARLDDGAILIGHSIGGTILIRTFADDSTTLPLAGIFLIAAPFVGDGGWQSEDIEPISGLDARLSEKTPIYLYHGSKDETAPFGHIDLYAQPFTLTYKLDGIESRNMMKGDRSTLLAIPAPRDRGIPEPADRKLASRLCE